METVYVAHKNNSGCILGSRASEEIETSASIQHQTDQTSTRAAEQT